MPDKNILHELHTSHINVDDTNLQCFYYEDHTQGTLKIVQRGIEN